MLVTVDGIVIGRRNIGENSCFIDVLTDEYGVIEATAHGVKKLTSKNAGAVTLFSYSKFCFNKVGVKYTLNSAEPKFSFHGISSDIEYLSLAVYFADIVKDTSASEQENRGFLRFMAVTLYELDKKRISLELIKSVFELHITTMLGFAPDLRACRVCAKYEHEKMFFDNDNACIICGDCIMEYGKPLVELIPLSPTLLYSMRHIVFSPVDKIYKIDVKSDDLKTLSAITEKYLLKQIDRGFRSLEYYYSVHRKI